MDPYDDAFASAIRDLLASEGSLDDLIALCARA